jgi:hypothetical protein
MAKAAAGKKITVVAFEASANAAAKPNHRTERLFGLSSHWTKAKNNPTCVAAATMSVLAMLENANTLGSVVNSAAAIHGRQVAIFAPRPQKDNRGRQKEKWQHDNACQRQIAGVVPRVGENRVAYIVIGDLLIG